MRWLRGVEDELWGKENEKNKKENTYTYVCTGWQGNEDNNNV